LNWFCFGKVIAAALFYPQKWEVGTPRFKIYTVTKGKWKWNQSEANHIYLNINVQQHLLVTSDQQQQQWQALDGMRHPCCSCAWLFFLLLSVAKESEVVERRQK
jgi:hypothetical protein